MKEENDLNAEGLSNNMAKKGKAVKMDNIEVGRKFDLYFVDKDVGKGLPILLPKGATMRRIIERFIIDEEIKRGYQHVITPDFAKVDLYRQSGHWNLYKNDMYPPMKIDNQLYVLRPMTCPHHIAIYKHKPRSYHNLPLRIAELAHQYRREQSGELRGLIRVRMFTLADAHIFCTPNQLESEFKSVLDLIKYCLDALGIKGYWFRLSLRDKKKDKYLGSDEIWNKAENAIKKALKSLKLKYILAKGHAAFYGPKLDVQVRNVYGKEDTLMTNQVDFQLPERFNLHYIDRKDQKQRPVIIHRASIGCIERCMGFLFEQYQGAFPFWLSPIQIKIINMNDALIPYAKKIEQNFRDAGFRVEGDYRVESIQKKVRDAEIENIPYIIVIGEREKKQKTIAVRPRGQKPKFNVQIESFIEELKKLEKQKK